MNTVTTSELTYELYMFSHPMIMQSLKEQHIVYSGCIMDVPSFADVDWFSELACRWRGADGIDAHSRHDTLIRLFRRGADGA
jgi:hypothetical protein